MRRVLILRPEPGASATVQRARDRGLDAIAVPLFEVEPVAWQVPEAGSYDGLLVTSANAVRHAGEALKALRGLPVYAVGPATAEAARDAGFDVASSGDAGVDRLLGSVDADLRLLHLAGEDRRAPTDARQRIEAISVYRSKPVSAKLDVRRGDVALVHSARAGCRLAELLPDAQKASVAIVAISREAADAAGQGWASSDVAKSPTDEALLALAERLCNNSVPQ